MELALLKTFTFHEAVTAYEGIVSSWFETEAFIPGLQPFFGEFYF